MVKKHIAVSRLNTYHAQKAMKFSSFNTLPYRKCTKKQPELVWFFSWYKIQCKNNVFQQPVRKRESTLYPDGTKAIWEMRLNKNRHVLPLNTAVTELSFSSLCRILMWIIYYVKHRFWMMAIIKNLRHILFQIAWERQK